MTPREFTVEMLQGWGGPQTFNDAIRLCHRGRVAEAEWDEAKREVTGKIAMPDGWKMPSGFTLDERGLIVSKCPCRTSQEHGLICEHVVALGFALMCRMNDPEAEAQHQRDLRARRRVEMVDPALYVRRSPNGTPMRLSLTWNENTLARDFYGAGVKTTLAFYDREGRRYAPEDPRLRVEPGIKIPVGAENILSVLEDVCEGPARSEILLNRDDFLNIAALLAVGSPVKCRLKASFDEESGRFELFPWIDLPFEHSNVRDVFLVNGRNGFVRTAELNDGKIVRWQFVRLENLMAEPFHSLYQQPEVIERESMPAFLNGNLPVLRRQIEVELSPSEDMFRFVPDEPVIKLSLFGTRASLGADLSARYGEHEIRCCAPAGANDICRPDPEDMLLYHVRNLPAEQNALKVLRGYGFEGDSDTSRQFITEPREVLNFLGGGYPALIRRHWKIEMSERLTKLYDSFGRIQALVDVADVPGGEEGEAEIGYTFDDGGRNITQSELQAAINRGESYLMRNGEVVIFDADAIDQMRKVFADCPSRPGRKAGHFRISPIYAPYVSAALFAIDDAVEFDDDNAPSWREVAAKRNRDQGAKMEPVDLGALEGTLRPYQKEGVYWMRFIEKSGMCGLLADEMGLGKTLQTLAWLSLRRVDPEAADKPALVVCPTSLVQNWAAEAEKFTPWMKCLVVSGAHRAEMFSRIPQCDIVVTSYALLQRDLEAAYLGQTFGVVVLDEAQHIKNRETRNARAAKQLRSVHRLVLTGTPVENSVADVWSIFDFLMPNYLGHYDLFKATVQDPIDAGGPEGAVEQNRLRQKLHPFILRRLKKTVAKDLPDKIVKVSYCPMTPEQQQWYGDLLADARRRIGGMVQEKGFGRSRMEILALLMRLRQAANHLELLKDFRERSSSDPSSQLSGKLDMFFELLDEAIDGGHRVLVFSQFVAMLSILRRELEARGIKYCYLDGSTQDRLGECRKFNTDESIPVFLISLHAGGTGLNLTGADMVVHFDPWWNPAVEDQATDRAHRIGQKRTVYVVKMIAENSVEERVLALQRKKQLVIDATIGTSDEAAVQKLTYDDIKAILNL